MSLDLNTILADWPYLPDENDKNVRVVVGDDGREKIQMRVKCGVVQWEKRGRPDGERPHGFDSMLDFCSHLLHKHKADGGRDDDFSLSEEVTQEVREEILDYYHRRVVRFQLSDYAGAKDDAEHNLKLMGYIKRFVDDPEIVMSHEQYRPFVLMDRARAMAMDRIENGEPPDALNDLDEGLKAIKAFYHEYNRDDLVTQSQELKVLRDLKERIRERFDLPFSDDEILQSLKTDLEEAVAEEDYQRAAEIKRRIEQIRPRVDLTAP